MELLHLPLNHEQRQRVCSLLALGATRRMAAEFVDCRYADLQAEITGDPLFQAQVHLHELRPEIEILRSLIETARDPKQWRAAAWILERFYPRRYSPRRRNTLQPAQLQAFLDRLEKQLLAVFPEADKVREFFEQLRNKKPRRSARAAGKET